MKPGAATAVHQVPGAASARVCARWLAQAEAALQRAARAGPSAHSGSGAPGGSNGIALAKVPALFDEVCSVLHGNRQIRRLLAEALGPRRVLLADHCWIRHQHPPAQRLAGQTPHSWHQDGALAFDFAAAAPPYPPGALLPMTTCWLPLMACGDDAPALGWFEPALGQLLEPASLAETAIRPQLAKLGVPGQEHHAVLAAGDALLFGGGLVHRTHATAGMQQHRISVELRWLPADAVPARLAAGRTVWAGSPPD